MLTRAAVGSPAEHAALAGGGGGGNFTALMAQNQ